MSGIFISYRRSDSPDATGRIYDRLVAEFGKAQVFKDVDSIPLGRDFRGHLNDIVGDCGVMLAIIGPHWTDARSPAGQRRLEDPDDFVRIELETALARDIPVVPVLVGHAPLPAAAELPESLASLVFRQSIEVRPDPDFHNDAARLVTALRAILDPEAAAAIAQAAAATGRQSSRRLGWIIAAMAILIAVLFEGATDPFWSPDSRSIGFFADGALKRLDLGGGAPYTLAPALTGFGGTWSSAGIILFAPGPDNPLMRVSATGGAARAATTLKAGQLGEGDPFFLPDGHHFLFYMLGSSPGTYLGDLTGSAPRRMTNAPSSPVYLQLTWFDRSGAARGSLGAPVDNLLRPSVAPDGRRVVVVRVTAQGSNIWLLDGARMSRLTFGASDEFDPVWSPDGTRIVFASNRSGALDLYQTLVNGAVGDAQPLLSAGQVKIPGYPTSWSPDGRFLLYTSTPQTGNDLWVVTMVGAHTPSVFLKTPFDESHGMFSPDGRWVAYESDESGRFEIYVRPFHPPGAHDLAAASSTMQWQVSTVGGIDPTWQPDGKEIDYLDPSGAMMAAPITVSGAGLAAGTPVKLFQTHIVGGGENSPSGREYDVAPDGRFLINTVSESAAAPITLIQNWNPAATPQ